MTASPGRVEGPGCGTGWAALSSRPVSSVGSTWPRAAPLAASLRDRFERDPGAGALAIGAALLAAAFFVLARSPILYGTVRAPLDILPGGAAQTLAILAPLPAALTAALCVLAPWEGLLVLLLLTPWFDAAQVGWWIGPLQVLGLTVFLAALLAGVALRLRDPEGRARLSTRAADHRLVFLGGLVLLGLATLSTALSADVGASGPVWLHGVLEPLVLGLLALLLVPDLRGLRLALLALGCSAALGGLINLVQTIPTVPSLLALQDHDRAIFSRLTYFNVGLFGEILAMAIPLLAAALVARRPWTGRRLATPVLAAALAICLICLYLTFSKSGWLAAGIALLVLALAWVRTGRARLAVAAAAVAVSMLVAPWPILVLRPVAPPLASMYAAAMTEIWGPARLATWDPSTAAGEVSITERLYASGAALRMALDHPLLGVGLDRFKAEYGGPYRDPRATVVLDAAHDLLPNLAAELGIPFAVLVAAAMAAAVMSAWRAWRRASEARLRLLAAGLGSSVLAWWIVSATFDPDLYRTWRLMASDIIFAAVLIGLALALPRLAEGRALQGSRPTSA